MQPTDNEAVENEIRALIERWVSAFRQRSVEAALAVFSEDVVSYDIVPPLSYVGAESFRAPWEAVFELFDGPIVMSIEGLQIRAQGDIAFSFCFVHFQGNLASGGQHDYWFRWTNCYERRDNTWLIVHDHQSVPTDFTTGRSRLDLLP